MNGSPDTTRKLLRGAGLTVLVLITILVLGLGLGYAYLRGSLPKVAGEITLAGLSAEVEVIRDRHAVPHIYAQTPADAYFALGFVHAQDRLWQMEFQRRVGAGRLSEVLGETTLGTDKFLRTLGVYRHAEATLPNLSEETRATLDAYVGGVNAFLSTRRGPLPPEFLLLRLEPEPFTPADVLVWGKMMAYDLSGNWTDELARARLLRELSAEQVAELFPPYPGDAPVVLPDFRALYKDLDLDNLIVEGLEGLLPGVGSNNWVVSGEKSETGMPLLANDPHLGLQAPSLWYFAHLSAPGLGVIGATLPGTPSVLLGRNDRIAWGFTNTGPDVQDLFIEQLNPDNSAEYLTPDGYVPFTLREEVIKVKGAEDVVLNVRETRHGPVISDVNGAAEIVAEGAGGAHVVAMSWTALSSEDLTTQAVLEMNTARDWTTFVHALENFHVPQQNIVYADVEGNIGYYAPARVPIRAAGNGTVPVPGWTGEYDWIGFVPFDELPHTVNPASAQVVTANHKVVPDSYPHFLTSNWSPPYRAERIETLLAATDKHSLASFAEIQADVTSEKSLKFLPLLLAAEPTSERGRDALTLLQDWDGSMSADAAYALLYYAWYRELVRLVMADDLGELFDEFYSLRAEFMLNVVEGETVFDWCDDITTQAQESCELISSRALEAALSFLSDTYGDDPAQWRWGAAHTAIMDHSVMTNTPLKRFFDLNIEVGGDPYTVNVGSGMKLGEAEPFRDNHGPGFRALYDLSDLDKSLYIHATGQSGNPLSEHYHDYLQRWRDVAYLPMSTAREDVEEAIGTLRLHPDRE